MDKYEKLLLESKEIEEKLNKKIITSTWLIFLSTLILYLGIIFLAIFTLEEGVALGTIVSLSTIIFVLTAFLALKFEVDAGYFECNKCKNRHVPTYMQALIAPHLGLTRYLKCPKCNKRSWNKKVLSK